METIRKSECQQIGFIRKTHGINGEVILEFEPQYEWAVEDSNRFFIEIDGLLVPFFVAQEGLRFKAHNAAIVAFDWVNTEKYAKRLVGKSVFLFKEEIIINHDNLDETYFKGFELSDEKLGLIGPIEEVDNFAGNVVFTVTFRGQETLIPFNEEFLINLDEEKKTITLRIPDGLLNS